MSVIQRGIHEAVFSEYLAASFSSHVLELNGGPQEMGRWVR